MSHGKPTDGYRVLGGSLEPTTMDLGSDATPIDRFFVCSAGDAVELDSSSWSLTVDGDAATGRTFGVDDLAALPQHRVRSWIECAGNGRELYDKVMGRPVPLDQAKTSWLLGAMAIAEWAGPRLGDVLEAAGIDASAAQYVAPTGLDVDNREGEPVRICLPIDKALDPDTIVALEMNGEPLPTAHGFPARLIVPGWVGAYSVKWLGRLEVATTWVNSWRADVFYRKRSPEGDDLGPATGHPVKSSLGVSWNAELPAGANRIPGYARSAAGPIKAVAWSLDDGLWHDAELRATEDRWAWTCFTVDVELEPGPHVIRTRATDSSGATQPEEIPWSPHGVLWNAITPHPVVAVL